ncbi:MAG: hypothetical protein AAF682_30910 [Planctomycetota bacterium]
MGIDTKTLRVFVGSPSDGEPERAVLKLLLAEINDDLAALEIPVAFRFLAWDDGVFPDVGRPQAVINERLDEADVVLLLFWHRFGSDAGEERTGTEEEFFRALERRHREGSPRILLFFKEAPFPYDVDTEQLARLRAFRARFDVRSSLLAGTFADDDDLRSKVRPALLSEARRFSLGGGEPGASETLSAPESATPWSDKRERALETDGFDSAARVFRDGPLPGRVFAVELLTSELRVAHSGRATAVELDRTEVADAIYRGSARRALRDLCLDTPDVEDWARRVDRRMHAVLAGNEAANLTLPLDRFPLRWASGGVFAIVSYRGRTWTPFFFRDIWPTGWNISLGASEATDNLQDPWSFLWREFLEELLVLRAAPRGSGEQRLEYRRPVFARNTELRRPAADAESFSAEHRELRRVSDGLVLSPAEDRPLTLDVHPTHMSLRVNGPHGQAHYRNVYVAVNPREVGIEVVVPVSYALDDGDCLLDGEVLGPEGEAPELVRMPVGLLSHDYLRRSFGGGQELVYDDDASILGGELRPDDLVVFDWDVERRLEIAASGSGHPGEVERHRSWREEYAEMFRLARDEKRFDERLRRFTATSAKVASYYFS